MYIYIYIYICIYAYVYIYIYICIYVCITIRPGDCLPGLAGPHGVLLHAAAGLQKRKKKLYNTILYHTIHTYIV